VQPGLVVVQHEQFGGPEPVDLAAQLGSDGSACTGDEHAPAGQVAGDGRDVDLDRAPAQQVGDVQVPQVGEPEPGTQHLAEQRKHLDGEACLGCGPVHLMHGRRVEVPGRDHEQTGPGGYSDVGDVVSGTADRDPGNQEVLQVRVVVKQGDR